MRSPYNSLNERYERYTLWFRGRCMQQSRREGIHTTQEQKPNICSWNVNYVKAGVHPSQKGLFRREIRKTDMIYAHSLILRVSFISRTPSGMKWKKIQKKTVPNDFPEYDKWINGSWFMKAWIKIFCILRNSAISIVKWNGRNTKFEFDA